MRRTRLETTRYGDVKPVPEDTGDCAPSHHMDQPSGREDRWAIRRSALSRQLVLDAQALFQRRMQRPVSENEARNMLGNLADYVWLLVQWEVSAVDPPASGDEKNRSLGPRSQPGKADEGKRRKSRPPPSS